MATIYGLRCKETGFVYVGCTAGKLGKRMREHRCLLRAGKHAARRLQADWLQYGEGAFVLEELERLECEAVEAKREAELRWFRRLADELYNDNLSSFAPCAQAVRNGVASAHKNPGLRWTPEANERRRLAQLGKPKGHGAKISATKRAKRG
jgi:hypothetical protein